MFFPAVKVACAPRGRACGVGQFFLLVKRLALRAGQRQSWFFFKLVLAPVARGWFFLLVKWLALRAGQR